MLKTDGLRCSIEECGDVDCAVAAIINKIVKLLLHPRTSLIKEIEGMEKGIMWMQEGSNKNRKGYTDGYNSAIENILNLIKGIK